MGKSLNDTAIYEKYPHHTVTDSYDTVYLTDLVFPAVCCIIVSVVIFILERLYCFSMH